MTDTFITETALQNAVRDMNLVSFFLIRACVFISFTLQTLVAGPKVLTSIGSKASTGHDLKLV
jgi:hypothetical protein